MDTSHVAPSPKPKKNRVPRRRPTGNEGVQIVLPNVSDNNSKDWKNHPILIAAISAAATATFFQTVVIPISDASNRAELVELRKAKATFEREGKRAAQLAKELVVSQHVNLFVAGNPYPVGFRSTPIGTPLNKVKQHFKDSDLTDRREILSVTPGKGAIKDIAFHYKTEGQEAVVTHIGYIIAFNDGMWGREDAEKLLAILTETFGPLTEVQEDVGARWHITSAGKSYWLYARDDFPSAIVTDINTRIKMW